VEAVISQWDPDVVYWGYDENGQPKEFRSRDEFFGMVLQAAATWETFTNELVEAYPVGPELVMCHLRCTRKAPAQDPFVFDVAQMLQLREGQIVRAAELIDSRTRSFLDSKAHG
jgi:ketosteroid isomerase-like protein